MSHDFSTASQPVPPGTRVKMLRILLNLSRDEFCKKHKLNFNTITSIELDRLKLSYKQLNKITQAFAKEGITVDEAWIREAKGAAPTHTLIGGTSTSYENMLREWMGSFLQSHHTIITPVVGRGMEPFYEDGDLVGGIWNTNALSLIGKRCIVQVGSSTHVGIFLRNGDEFVLVPHNLNDVFQMMHLNSSSLRVAEILWHMRQCGTPIAETSSLPTLTRNPTVA